MLQSKTAPSRQLLAAGLLIISLESVSADTPEPRNDRGQKRIISLSIDNDLFVPSTSDKDYTAGFAVNYSSPSSAAPYSPENILSHIDRVISLQGGDGTRVLSSSIELGSYGFTPEDIETTKPLSDDRPYSSIVYVSSSHAYQKDSTTGIWTTSLTVGLLGLEIFEKIQNGVHDLTGSNKAEGWDQQISDGGEPTIRYQIAYHQYWKSNSKSSKFKTTIFGSAGYLTEGGISISTRQGKIVSPDYRFNPELINYGERANNSTSRTSGPERYFWGGVSLRARAYNAFLQGQFRNSSHTLSRNQLRPIIAEAWLGYTCSLSSSISLSYVIRAQSSEIRSGEGDRNMLWGGLTLSRAL